MAWVIVLAPSLLKPRFESSPIDGVRNFERSMGILANTRSDRQVPGRFIMVPKGMQAPRSRRQRVLDRRRRWFARLLAASVITLALGLIPALRSVLWLHLGIDAALAIYVVQLRVWASRERQRRRVLRRMPVPAQDDAPITEPVPPVVVEHDGDEVDEPRRAAGSTG